MKTNRLINLGLLFFTILFCTTSCSKSSTNPSNITISDKDIYFVVKYTGQWATGCTSCDTTYQVYSGMPIFDNRPSQDVNSNINYNFIYTGRYLNIILKSELAVKTYQNASSSTLMTNDDFGIDYTNFPYPYSNLIAVSGQLQITKIQQYTFHGINGKDYPNYLITGKWTGNFKNSINNQIITGTVIFNNACIPSLKP